MTRDEFVQLVVDSYHKTDLKPIQYEFFDDSDQPCGCALVAIASADGIACCDVEVCVAAAKEILECSDDFLEGVMAGFDELFEAPIPSDAFRQGFSYGLAAAEALGLVSELVAVG